jgi:hypothetical protein
LFTDWNKRIVRLRLRMLILLMSMRPIRLMSIRNRLEMNFKSKSLKRESNNLRLKRLLQRS